MRKKALRPERTPWTWRYRRSAQTPLLEVWFDLLQDPGALENAAPHRAGDCLFAGARKAGQYCLLSSSLRLTILDKS